MARRPSRRCGARRALRVAPVGERERRGLGSPSATAAACPAARSWKAASPAIASSAAAPTSSTAAWPPSAPRTRRSVIARGARPTRRPAAATRRLSSTIGTRTRTSIRPSPRVLTISPLRRCAGSALRAAAPGSRPTASARAATRAALPASQRRVPRQHELPGGERRQEHRGQDAQQLDGRLPAFETPFAVLLRCSILARTDAYAGRCEASAHAIHEKRLRRPAARSGNGRDSIQA